MAVLRSRAQRRGGGRFELKAAETILEGVPGIGDAERDPRAERGWVVLNFLS